MDLLLGKFVNKYINKLKYDQVDPYFLDIKQRYDAEYDLITYNKQTREFIATDNFNKKIH